MEISTPRAPRSETSSMSGLEIASSAERSARLSPEASPVPIIALPISRMTARTSAKSRLMRPSFTIRSVMQATPEWSTWSAIAKASTKVVFSLATRNRFWFGMMISVSTLFCSSVMPASASRMRRWPSKWNGLVTTPTVRMPSSRAARATTGEAPVPVPPPMPAVTNTMWAPARWSLISSITSSAAPRPTSGCEPAPSPSVTCTPIWMMRSARDVVSAWASVLATTKSTPWRPALIMLLTALPPAPPTPNTVIRGFSSRMSGIFRLMLMAASQVRGRVNRRLSPAASMPGTCDSVSGWSKALAKPSSDASDVAARPCLGLPHVPRFDMLEMRELRIDQETRRHRESRPLGRLRHCRNAERPADAHGPAQDAGRKVGKPRELARAAGEDDAAAGPRRKRGSREAVANDLEDLLGARLDDARQHRPRHEARCLTVIPARARHGDHVALIRSSGEHTAIERLDSLGVLQADA